MTRVLLAALAALVIGVLAAACGGGSGSASTHPTHAARIEGFGETLGASLKTGAGPSEVISQMGNSWLLQVCQEKSDAALQGVTATKAETFFAQGYDATAPAGAPSAKAVFGQISAGCATEGV